MMPDKQASESLGISPPLRVLRDLRGEALIFRPYQLEAFENRTHGLEVWLWGRQTGKSFTLAAWAVDRLLKVPGRLVTILSNSRANGMELNLKCAEVCRLFANLFEQEDQSSDHRRPGLLFSATDHAMIDDLRHERGFSFLAPFSAR